MKLTEKQREDWRPIFEGLLAGGELEGYQVVEKKWCDNSVLCLNTENIEWNRIKPEPEYEPWTYETCPLNPAIREKGSYRVFHAESTTTGMVLDGILHTWQELFDRCEWVQDDRSVLPCGRRVENGNTKN